MIDRPAKVERVQTPVEKLMEKSPSWRTIAQPWRINKKKCTRTSILKRFDQLLAKSE
jgi:hypothetical protein